MRLLNDLNLPEPLVEAIEHRDSSYDKGQSDYSVTQLIAPPRIVELKRQWHKHLVDDASNRIFALFGQAVHTILERSAGDRYVVEKRYFIEHDGAKISGQIDLYDRQEKSLQDWKICSYHVAADGAKPEWIAQGNLNRYILWKNGIRVKEIKFIGIFRDWSKLAASRKSDYPQNQVKVLPIPLWSQEEVEAYLSERISLHRAAAIELPMCSSEERWERPHKWAVMAKGKKRALKLHDSEEEARKHSDKVEDSKVEDRPGENVRCLHYCPVVQYCDFGREQQLQAAGE